ncbi:T9SS type B sorting domain-containing protein [Winogradskyella sp. PG-2]|uniref:T9SS type B sorting domain-containing protein n=1 Tax=Winogradskyella sp. PG-2 TaxID=754409 RepID=UPI00045883A0|nr:T9SS type B sorting domain-containing protein [Winogradskyella sp. PG-2]BAO74665.1 hypothetical protein WPG_0435 [Winogradskyella sp. PG-2]
MKNILLLFIFLTSGIVFSQDILMQNGTFSQCTDVFYDSGGEFGNYSLDENFVTTICSDVPGDFVALDFTLFDTQQGLNVDTMNIYDGDDTSANLIGSYFGPTTDPGLISATAANTSGCLTIEFISNDSGTSAGWAADILCFTPCQTITASIDSTNPPAASGIIEVDPGEQITFDGSATFSGDGTGATYTWDFGNGDMLTGESVNYAYPNPGSYTLTLTVTDTNPLGCSGTDSSIQVNVLDNDTCAGALPICDGISDVPSPVGTGAAEAGIDYGCLGSQPRPRWYFLQTGDEAGDLSFTLTQTSGPNGTGGGNDVDFIIWGPFAQPECGADDLNASTQVDCSFSAAATEQIDIPNAPANSYYVLLITNYSTSAGFINLVLNPDPNSNATTNCDIICQVDLGDDQELCNSADYTINPSFNGAFNTFEWQKDGVTIPGETSSTLTVTESGTYTLIADGSDAVFGDPCTSEDEVVITIADDFILNDIALTECSATTIANFDLDAAVADILNPLDTMDYTVSFHNNQPDAENGNAAVTVTNSYSGTDGEILYVRVVANGTSCFSTSTVTLGFSIQPTINVVNNLMVCDDFSNDGFGDFDLGLQTATILGSQSPTDFTVTYHTSIVDAEMGVGALPDLYTNTSNSQDIYVRIESVSDSNCYNVTGSVDFTLTVNTRAIGNMPENMMTCDDVSNDGVEQFDLSTQEADILAGQDPSIYNVSFHDTQDDADNNEGALPTLYSNTDPNIETVYVRVEDPLHPDCYGTTSFDLIVNPLPIVSSVTPLQVCDDDTDGFVGFPLSTKEAELLNGQTGIEVSFHENMSGAEMDTAEIFDGYINTTANNDTVYVRLENTMTSCYNVTALPLEVLENPIANPTTPLEVCDDDNDGLATFNLSLRDVEVIGTQTGMVVNYYDTEAEAIAGNNPLANNYSNIVAGSQVIYARIENDVTGCYATTTLQLIVNPLPTTIEIGDYELCDENNPGDGQELFNLTTKDAEIINGQVNVTVAYYGNQMDADLGINEITTLYANTISNPQEVFAVLTNTLTNCSSNISFDLVVNPLPSLIAPTALEVCDDATPDGLTEMDLSLKNIEITGNNPSYAVSYYENLSDAQSETSPLPTLYTNTSNGQIIYVRVEDTGTGCYDTTTLELVVEQAPIANPIPTALTYCDPDNDGFGVFMLTDADNDITGGAAGLTVSYHETYANADNNVDAIDTTVDYNNIVVDEQTLYARVESATIATACATLVELQLIVEPSPQIIEPTPLEECDDISADGFASFDLTTKADEVLNGADATDYIVSYYETPENANDANNPIANPTAYTNTENTQTIWIRVEDSSTAGGCYKVTSLVLKVNPLPVLVQPSPLEECDVNNPGDESEAFMLDDARDEILNGQTGITLTYYETQADADAATSPIGSSYTNTSNAQTIYVRAENDDTGCYSTITLTLRVDPIPSPEPDPDPIEVCDDDNDGFAEFDLEQRTIEIINGELDVVISYHETEEEANLGDNPITGLYTNIMANSQMIYVRSENTITGCYSLTLNTLELIVVPSPEVPTDIAPYVLCDDDANGMTQFDLTTKASEILGTQSATDVILTYHLSAAAAEAGNSAIINVGNYTNTMNPQVIYVRLFNPTTGCQDTGEFELQVELPPVAVQPTPLEDCDDLGESPGDEMTTFDLTLKDAEITGGNASWSVDYYETDADAQSQMNAIPDPTQYTNTSIGGLPQNPQTLYVVVTDTDTGCVDFTTMTIRVLPNPTPTDILPDLVLCDDINTGDGEEVFDLTENEILLLNGEVGVTPTYHETPEDADSGSNPILDPINYTNTQTPQTIYVRVTNDVTGCYTIVDFALIVNPLPAVIAVTDFIQCELNTDGIDSFDLTTKDAEVLNGQDPMEFVVTYHESLLDAEAEMNALVSPYTNLTNPQEIFVTITNTVTGCSISTQRFNIQVDEAAQANPDMEAIVYEECDDNMGTDGNPSNDSVQFDLATRDPEVLDGQDPANYIVTYYATEDDANLNVNPLPNLYENIVNPQVIYARVDNNTLTVISINLDLAGLATGLDLDGDGTIDTYDADADGVFDLIDVDGDGISDAIDTNADGFIDFVDVDGDGQGDPVDITNDGVFDNQVDGSICFEVAELTLQVNPLPEFDLEDSYILCIDTNGTEVLSSPVLDTGLSETDYSFEWSYNGAILPTETGSSLAPTQGGTYSVIVTDISTSSVTSCVNMDSTEVIESAPPSLTAEVVTQLFGDNNVIEAVATGIGDYEYSLDNGPWQDSGVFTNVSSGIRIITARDKIGCGLVSVEVQVIDYPLYFTPNGDGNHDTWNIEGIGSSAKIYIFDRYGKLLKQLSPTGSGWDGTFNGSLMPTSDYWFTVIYNEPINGNQKEFKAHFTLKR